MLAKQWWRIVHDDNLLSSQVLQAKYFPNDRPVDAKFKPGCSSICSLMAGKQLVDEGSIWRVGDGKTINVWKDKWIRKPPSFKPTPPDRAPTPLKVEALIDGSTGKWDSNMITDMFTPDDRERIKAIHLAKKPI